MRVLIVGAGIAGPVLGAFLARAGFRVVLCEGRAAPVGDAGGDAGAFLGLAPSGMHVLGELGLSARVESLGAPCDGFSFLNSAGKEVGAIDRSGDERTFGARLVMIRRADLHRVVLEEAARLGVEIHYGRRLLRLDRENPAMPLAHFEDGSVERAEMVVGCDGLRSRVRGELFPEAAAPGYSGLLDFGGFAHMPESTLRPGWNVMVFGKRAFFGAFRVARGGVAADEVWWFHNGGARSPLRSLSPDERRRRILESHRDDPSWIGACVEATPEILGPWPLHEVASLRRWHEGVVGVIGDAAHATSPSGGLGASLALEDALLLARILRSTRAPERAFELLEEQRRPRVDEAVRHSRRNASAKSMPGPVAAKLRDWALPFFLRMGQRAQEHAYGYRVSWNDSVEGTLEQQ